MVTVILTQCQVLYLPPLKVISCTLPNHFEDKTTLKILKTKLHIDFLFMLYSIQQMDQCDCVLHIIPDKKSFQLQKIDLGMHMLFGNTPNQVYFKSPIVEHTLQIFFICCNMTIYHILYIFYRENTCINIIYMQCKWSLSFKPGNKQPHFLLQIQMVFGSVAERKAPAARKIDAEEFYKYVYIRYILVFSAFTSIFI